MAEATGSATLALRAAAFEAIARRAAAMPLAPGLTEIVIDALNDSDPPVRAAAARALSVREDAASHLFPLLDDPDDGVRATALKAVAAANPEKAASGFRDPSPAVRAAALDVVTGCGQGALVEQAIAMIAEGGFADTLGQACRRHPIARQTLLAMLRKTDTISRQGLLMILEAMGHAVDAEQEVPVDDGRERVKPATYVGVQPITRA